MDNHEPCGDTLENNFRKRAQHPSERDMLKFKGYLLHGVVGEGTYSKVKKNPSLMLCNDNQIDDVALFGNFNLRQQNTVKRASSLALRRDVAIKIICRDEAPTVFRQRFLPREIEILSFVQHPHIVKVYEIFETKVPARVYIVTEFLHGGDLLDHVKEHGAVVDSEARYIFFDICRATAYLHDNLIAHRDIKCENILLDRRRTGQKFYAKLCDFGFAKRLSNEKPSTVEKSEKSIDFMTTTFCGSAAYASPEILERKPHNPMLADVWALGIVFFITLFGSMPFDDRDIKSMIQHQKRDNLMKNRTKKVCRHAQDLVALTLRPNPQSRLSVRNLLRHTWFRVSHSSKQPIDACSSSMLRNNKLDSVF